MRHARPAVLFAAVLLLAAGTAGPAAGTPGPATRAHPVALEAPGPAAGAHPVALLSPDANPGEQIPLDLETLLDALGIDVLAVDMFLKIEGIDGESTAAGGHVDWIEIESFSWGASRPSTSTGRTRGGGRASFSDMSVVKRIDAASPNLYLACASGKRYPSATLQIRKAGEGPVPYMEYRLENVRISSVSVSSSEGSAEPVEEVTLSYGKIVWTYMPQDATRQGGGVEKSWNLEANQEG